MDGTPTKEAERLSEHGYSNHMGASSTRKRPTRSTFIRRRIAVLFGLAALIAVVVIVISGPQTVASWFGAGSASTDAAVSADGQVNDEQAAGTGSSEAAGGDPIHETPEPTECVEGALLVEAVVDQTSYAPTELPKISLRVTNQGEIDCDADLGTNTMLYEIRSGTDLYWSSRDCQRNEASNPVRVRAGETLEAEPLEWDRTRSSAETCDIERSPAPGGGASYHLSVAIAGVESFESKQFILY